MRPHSFTPSRRSLLGRVATTLFSLALAGAA
jgi:hypothetical protein